MSTNAAIGVELVGHPFTHVVDNLASGSRKQIDIEHPTFESLPMENKDKGKAAKVSSESTSGKPTNSHLNMFLDIFFSWSQVFL